MNARNLATATTMLLTIAAGSASAAPPLSGAIFTTTADGSVVNGNTKYAAACDVYLDGGPGENAPQGAAGLPDGDYYFQVTDPSGKILLSTDPVRNRCVTVSEGIITGNCTTGTHVLGNDVDHPPARTVQLCPYNLTPNPGGVYKAWMTPVGDGTINGGGFVGNPALVDNPCGNGCFHGFIPARSKTDNFKVKRDVPTFCINVHKDKIFSDGSTRPLSGLQVLITEPVTNVTNNYFTDEFGDLEVCGLVAGTYTVEENLTTQGGVAMCVIDTTVNGTSVGPDASVEVQLSRTGPGAAVEYLNGIAGTTSCPAP
jgi:hypothetical protein